MDLGLLRGSPEDRLKRGLVWGGQLALTVLVTWFIVRQVGLGMEAVAQLDPAQWVPDVGLLIGASLILVMGMVLSGILWGQVVRDLGGTSLSHGDAARIFIVANLGRYIPGKIWQVTGLAVLARRRGVSGGLSSFSAVVAHGVSLCAAALVGGVVFAAARPGDQWTGRMIPAALVAGALLALLPPVFRQLLGLLDRVGLKLDWELLHPLVVAKWLGLFVIHWGIYGVSFLVLARSFGLPGGAIEVTTSYVAAYVVGYLAIFAPAGLGVREASLVALLAPVMGQGPAAGLAVTARVWSTVVEVLPAFGLWGLEVVRGGGAVLVEGDEDPTEPR